MNYKSMSVSASSHNSDINQNSADSLRDWFFVEAMAKKNGFISKPDWLGFDAFLDNTLKGFTPKEYATPVQMRLL